MKTQEEIEQLARNVHFDMHTEGLNADGCFNQYQGFIKGYTQCQEDNVNKKYTEEDIRKAIMVGIEFESGDYPEGFNYKLGMSIEDYFIESLNKQD